MTIPILRLAAWTIRQIIGTAADILMAIATPTERHGLKDYIEPDTRHG